jgi:hypothetical protein
MNQCPICSAKVDTWGSIPLHCNGCGAKVEFVRWRWVVAHSIPIFGTIGVWDMVMQRFHSQFLAGAIAAGAFAALSFLSWRVFLRLRISKKSPKA